MDFESDPGIIDDIHPRGGLGGRLLWANYTDDVHPAGTLQGLRIFTDEPSIIDDVHPEGHLISGIGHIRRLARTNRRPAVYLRSPWFPRQRIAELSTYFSPDRSFSLMDWGQGVVTVNRNDPAIGKIEEGFLLEIDDANQPPWIGVILKPRDSLRGGYLEIPAIGYDSILDGHITPQDEKYSASVSTGLVVRSLLRRMNARDDTGIVAGTIEAGPSMLDFEAGGQSIFAALSELHERSNMEFGIRWDASPGHAQAFLDWKTSLGVDFSNRINLETGIHFSDLDRVRDLSKAVQATTVTGGLGRPLSERPSVTQAGPTTAQRRDIGATARFNLGESPTRRLTALPPALRTEKVMHSMMTENLSELSRTAETGGRRPLLAVEMFTADVNTLADWRFLTVGNYVSITADFGRGRFTRRARIRDAQPSNDVGLIQLNLEVPY